MAATIPMGLKFCHGRNLCSASPRLQENIKSTSLPNGTMLESLLSNITWSLQLNFNPNSHFHIGLNAKNKEVLQYFSFLES